LATIKLGHWQIQIRPQGVKTGQYPAVYGTRLVTPEPFLNSADADQMSLEGIKMRNTRKEQMISALSLDLLTQCGRYVSNARHKRK